MMDELIRKQSHGINDLEYLIDEARSSAKESKEFVENAVLKFETNLEVSDTFKVCNLFLHLYTIILFLERNCGTALRNGISED